MTTTRWPEWIQRWLAQHPVRTPAEDQQAAYTRRVMARVRAQGVRAPSPMWGWGFAPRAGWAFAAAAGVIVVVGLLRHTAAPTTRQLLQEEQTLAEVWEPVDLTGDGLEDELRESDRIQLAQTLPWLDHAAADEEEAVLDDAELSSDEELLEELRWVDQADSAPS